uniref:Tc1-like transposase DDE domain-containing protein n=1 Tax=Oncorhynchus tshawytscha TaxID=74940 RepID=A0AAZ3NR99_ONCTS
MKTYDTKEAFLLTLKNTKRKMPRVPAHLREGGMDCRFGQGNKLQCPYCETPKTALQGDRTDHCDRPRSGRPRITTPAQDRYIRTSHLRDRYRMATTTARVTPGMHNPSMSAQTVRNRLREAVLGTCRPVVRQVLTRHHRQQRSLWAQTHHRWTRQDWQKVLFTDESRFFSPGVMGGFAFIVEGMSVYTEACTLERDQFRGGGSAMVWGGMSQPHRTELVVIAGNLNAVRYREVILLPHVVPFLQAHPDMALQHDIATSHTARSVRDFLQNRNVSVLPWPAKSPDLNPIEYVWDLLDRNGEG